jgi:hypothetical protein
MPDQKSTTAPVKATAPAPAPADTDTPHVRRDQLDQLDPAAVALKNAVEADERKRLTEERDQLRKRLPSDDSLPALRAEVDALRVAVARAGVRGQQSFPMSAGVHADLLLRGHSVDPVSGATFVRDGDTDRVQVIHRGGDVEHVTMPEAPKSEER